MVQLRKSLIIAVTLFCHAAHQVQCFSATKITAAMPAKSPATGLENKFYEWKCDQRIRYQSSGLDNDGPSVLLVHGLFVNSDHWRFALRDLSRDGYRVFAIDLLGNGYSSKPKTVSEETREQICGESRRFGDSEAFKEDVTLGTSGGGTRTNINVDLRHPLRSIYNFYTWADVISDFTRDIVLEDKSDGEKVTLVSNSIGTISALQSILDYEQFYNGLFIVNPNFRELHSAEIPFSKVTMPIIRSVQSLLRNNGKPLFDSLAIPSTVKQILKEPYAIEEAIDDELVDVLLSPLLTDGSAEVVFDTLSYSAGPLPEQQLTDLAARLPVWVCYGSDDPWTPPARVEALPTLTNGAVEKVISLDGIGHCPHDEAPQLVNPLLVEFLNRVQTPSLKSEIQI
mmetsp:Transcript_20494/g.19724  ORF Transcript_20494/g.19724 Transcript_20494/m.19724 type:complete len:397 (-) Transcript_20494:190-1380(-)|eukprot:CAMPEP_0197836464 /NCGR_PEP_ID=MMETSP1437-20131217/29059_1 /TAXON_ID=49252 ORGANISM="Eucampia antarctica, Strain CCMP1452" /NCGR_SAMPLE_ID=MMETSP1437 /ASSEMBLY_ACC=CAM_ASM_001096 /LENGTH=396 /DNA_ID=CAMNT_0043442659 /DNA_START=18 /DNA_END=1208 /DNA_ORIENTATION=-